MKPSSADGREPADDGGLSRLPRDRAGGVAGKDVAVRPARLDRQLGAGTIDPAYSDDHLEGIVRAAADEARERARTEGYAAGWSQGRQAAAQQARVEAQAAAERMRAAQEEDRERVKSLIALLGDAIVTTRKAAVPQWEEVADTLADGALRIARAAISRELSSIDKPVLEAVRGALRGLATPGEAIVHLNPDDASLVGSELPSGIRVVPDPTVPAGGVVALTPAQRLALDLPAALAAAERVLRA